MKNTRVKANPVYLPILLGIACFMVVFSVIFAQSRETHRLQTLTVLEQRVSMLERQVLQQEDVMAQWPEEELSMTDSMHAAADAVTVDGMEYAEQEEPADMVFEVPVAVTDKERTDACKALYNATMQSGCAEVSPPDHVTCALAAEDELNRCNRGEGNEAYVQTWATQRASLLDPSAY